MTDTRGRSASTGDEVIRIERVSKHFDGVCAVDELSLSIRRGEVFVILGGSGCGKTTLLRLLAGLERADSGRILIDGVDVTAAPPYERPVNMMFQSYALFPHMTVERNVAYGLRKEGLPGDEIRQRVADMLALVRLSGLARRKPEQLSGGQRQRVALARALIKRPRVLLLDEPLAALDRKLREHTQFELMNIQYRTGTTFLVVTHDQEEAMTLASRIAVMEQGRFLQVGTPNEVYENPANRHVADFVGTTNLLECRVARIDGAMLELDCGALGISLRVGTVPGVESGARVWVAVRPEKIQLGKQRPDAGGRCVLAGVVQDLAYYGGRSIYRVITGTGQVLQVSAQNRVRSAERVLEWDESVFLCWEADANVVLVE